MNVHSILPPEWVAARMALVEELTCLRNQLSCGMPDGQTFDAAGCAGARGVPRLIVPGRRTPSSQAEELADANRQPQMDGSERRAE